MKFGQVFIAVLLPMAMACLGAGTAQALTHKVGVTCEVVSKSNGHLLRSATATGVSAISADEAEARAHLQIAKMNGAGPGGANRLGSCTAQTI